MFVTNVEISEASHSGRRSFATRSCCYLQISSKSWTQQMSFRKTRIDRSQTYQIAGPVQNASKLKLLPLKHILRRNSPKRYH